MTATLQLYTAVHANLAFSSIAEAQRAAVVERCYWPLLRLAAEGWPVGLEASGWTLEQAAAIDPAWIAELRRLVDAGRVELIGSGYVQLIGPLVPADVNRANLALGHEAYERLVGRRPRVALVHEQAWSASLVPLYLEAGYAAVVMEWENPFALHPAWDRARGRRPQRAAGPDGTAIPVLWNHSIAFQKFQRYAHGELELGEYVEWLAGHADATPAALALYGGDAEVFDFRPGRYRTEAALAGESEWARIGALLAALRARADMRLALPSEALGLLDPGTPALALGSAACPSPVKKQAKYTLTRWAVTGRDDLGLNTACFRAREALAPWPADRDGWRALCELWSSDYRTHIRPERWEAVTARAAAHAPPPPRPARAAAAVPPAVRVRREGRWLELETDELRLRLNARRGLAVDACWFKARGPRPVVGSLPHGYFDDVALSADQYTGFLVLAAPGEAQVTDLEPVEPDLAWLPDEDVVSVRGTIATPLGPIDKEVRIAPEGTRVEIRHHLRFSREPVGTLRLGHITLLPDAFDPETLFYATHLGGERPERFALAGEGIDQLAPVSHLVSCRTGLGLTEGVAWLGDARTAVRVEAPRATAALLGLLTARPVPPARLVRLTLSARELDETSRPGSGPMLLGLADARLAVAFADGTEDAGQGRS